MKIICALVFMVVAVQASFMGINEKWRIRHEWWRQHNDSLTERERSALVADGANLTLGPLILGGGRALLLFSITALVLHFVVKRKTH